MSAVHMYATISVNKSFHSPLPGSRMAKSSSLDMWLCKWWLNWWLHRYIGLLGAWARAPKIEYFVFF